MQQSGDIDAGRESDWGRTSRDYAQHRPGPPASFYDKLLALDVVRPGQRLLDLGTGTGVVAREFASRGFSVAGADVAESQVDIAKELAHEQGLSIDFRTAPAEDLPFDDSSFDVITANQCWLYFDLDRTLPELRRVARPGARLVTSHFTYLPRASRVARETERLVLRYNPKWSAADWDGRIPANPRWSRGVVTQRAMFYYDELIPFTWESWRGRMRAHRGVGASLTPEEVEAFDRDLDELLRSSTPEGFTVVHRIDAHAFELDDEPGASVPES